MSSRALSLTGYGEMNTTITPCLGQIKAFFTPFLSSNSCWHMFEEEQSEEIMNSKGAGDWYKLSTVDKEEKSIIWW